MAFKGREAVPPVHHQHSAQYTTAFPALAEVYLTPCPSVIQPQDATVSSHIASGSAASSRRSSSGTRGVPRAFASAAQSAELRLSLSQPTSIEVSQQSGTLTSTETLHSTAPSLAGQTAPHHKLQTASDATALQNESRVVTALQHAPSAETPSGGDCRAPAFARSRSTPRLGSLSVPQPPPIQQQSHIAANLTFPPVPKAAVGSALSPTTPPTSASASSSARSLRGPGSPKTAGLAGSQKQQQTRVVASPSKQAAASLEEGTSKSSEEKNTILPLPLPATHTPPLVQQQCAGTPPLSPSPTSPVEASATRTSCNSTQEHLFKQSKQRTAQPFASGVLRPPSGVLVSLPQETPPCRAPTAFWCAANSFARGGPASSRHSSENCSGPRNSNGAGLLRGSLSAHQHPLARLCLQPLGENAFRSIFRGGQREGQRQRVAGVDMWRFSDGCISPRIEGTALYVYLQQQPEGLPALERALMGCILFLYEEGIKPFAGEIAHQMRKRADAGTWVPCEVLALAMACKDLSPRIERRVKGEDGWVLLLKPHVEPANFQGFIDTRASENLYSEEQWLHFNRYFIDKLREGAAGLSCFSAGRYALAERLRQEVPYFRRCRLAHLIRMIQLASWRRVLTYREKALIPVAACPLAARDFLQRHFPDPSGARAAAHAHSISQLLKTLRKVVNSEPLGVFLAQLKDLVRASSHGRIDAGLLGHAKLQDLLLAEPFSRFYRLYTPSASEHCTFVQSKQYALPEGAIPHTKAAVTWGSGDCPMDAGVELSAWGPREASVWSFKTLVPIACSCCPSASGGPRSSKGNSRAANCLCQRLQSGSGSSWLSRIPPRDNPWSRARKAQSELSQTSYLLNPLASASPPKSRNKQPRLPLPPISAARRNEAFPLSSGNSTAPSVCDETSTSLPVPATTAALASDAALFSKSRQGEISSFFPMQKTPPRSAFQTGAFTSPPPPVAASTNAAYLLLPSSRVFGKPQMQQEGGDDRLSSDRPPALPANALSKDVNNIANQWVYNPRAADVAQSIVTSPAQDQSVRPRNEDTFSPAPCEDAGLAASSDPKTCASLQKVDCFRDATVSVSPLHAPRDALLGRQISSSSTAPEAPTEECFSPARVPKNSLEQVEPVEPRPSVQQEQQHLQCLTEPPRNVCVTVATRRVGPGSFQTAGDALQGDGCEALPARPPMRPLRSAKPQAAFRRSLSVSRVEGTNKRLAMLDGAGEHQEVEPGAAFVLEIPVETVKDGEANQQHSASPSKRQFISRASSTQASSAPTEDSFKKQLLKKSQIAASTPTSRASSVCVGAHRESVSDFNSTSSLMKLQLGSVVTTQGNVGSATDAPVFVSSFSRNKCRSGDTARTEEERPARQIPQAQSLEGESLCAKMAPTLPTGPTHQVEVSASPQQSLGFSAAVTAFYTAENWALQESLSEADKALEPPLQFLLHPRTSTPCVSPAVFAVQHSEG